MVASSVRIAQEEGGEEDEQEEEREHLESSFPHGRLFCLPEGAETGMGWRRPGLTGEELPRRAQRWRLSRRAGQDRDGQGDLELPQAAVYRLSPPRLCRTSPLALQAKWTTRGGLALLACNLFFQEIVALLSCLNNPDKRLLMKL